MSFLTPESNECCTNEFDLVSVPMTQTAIESTRMVEYRPISTLTSEGPIEFAVPGDTAEYIHPAYMYLYVRCKITKHDGNNLTVYAAGPPVVQADNVAPVNNFLHSLFSQVDVSLNDKLITSSAGSYAHRAYLETILNYSEDASKTHLSSALWYKDTAGQFNAVSNENTGYQKRKAIAAGSREFEMYGKIFTDICGINRVLPNKVSLRVKLYRNKDAFCLMGGQNANFLVKLEEVTLHVRRITVSPDLGLELNKYMLSNTAKLPYTRVETRVHTIPQGVQTYNLDNLFLGNVPKAIVIGFVSNTAYNGSYQQNPFHFEHFNVNKLQVQVGSNFYPPTPLTPNFADNLYLQSYYTLFSGTGIFYNNAGHTITQDDYPGGYTLYSFILSPTNTLDDCTWDVVKDSPVNIKISFSADTPQSITCIVYAQFDSLVQIDKDRNVYTDTSV
jgi:hypothetical protein